jgi:uncharacterized protein YbjT (DUF2867 family)
MAAGLNSSPNKGMQGKARVAMVGLVITIAQRKGGAGKTTSPLSSLSRGRAVARGLRHLISIRKAVSQLGSICAARGLGQRRSVLILPHAEATVPYVVTLSSVGADLTEKSGPILGLHNLEVKLNAIQGLNVLHLRPAGFMENLFMSVQPLRTMGMLPGPLPADEPHAMIAGRDIGAYAAERLHARDFSGSSVQELHGQRDVTMKEVAAVVGNAIGKPKLGYMQVPFLMLEPAMVQTGLPKSTVALMIEMWKSMNSGALKFHEPRNAKNTTPTPIETFIAEVFAPAYSSMAAKA